MWGAVYRAADCDPQSLVLDSTLVYGDCVGGSLPNGAKVSSIYDEVLDRTGTVPLKYVSAFACM